jgi:glycosyltransferase involved in cell wall biosynthesis
MSENASTSVGVVVPTRNSARTLGPCLDSMRAQTVACHVVVVDNHSEDDTQAIARAGADELIVKGPERSAQRNAGAAALSERIIGFIDSDMTLEPDVIREVQELIAGGAGAVIVPETSFGVGFWANVRAFERSFYDGDDTIEAARFFDRAVLDLIGGFDDELDPGPEDWDLTIRVREVARVERTVARIWHDEGELHYLQACGKKAHYAAGLQQFGEKHGWRSIVKALDRPYFRRPWRLLWPHPMRGLGVLALKGGEMTAVLWRIRGSRSS